MFNRVQGRDHVASVALLEHRATASRIIVANAHIFWNPEYRDVKLVQTALLIEELGKIVDRFGKLSPRLDTPDAPRYNKDNKVPVVLCGDFNSEPSSGVYEFINTGALSPHHEDFMGFKYGSLTTDGLRHGLNLKSSYGEIGELPLTNHTPGFSGVIDYIWYSADSLQVTAVMGEVDKEYMSRTVGFPNAVSALPSFDTIRLKMLFADYFSVALPFRSHLHLGSLQAQADAVGLKHPCVHRVFSSCAVLSLVSSSKGVGSTSTKQVQLAEPSCTTLSLILSLSSS